MSYILFAKGIEEFNINNESLGIGHDRSVYYCKSIGRHRLYRSSYPLATTGPNKKLSLFVFSTLKQAEDCRDYTNKIHNDRFEVIETVLIEE